LKEFSEHFNLAEDIGAQPICARMNAAECCDDLKEESFFSAALWAFPIAGLSKGLVGNPLQWQIKSKALEPFAPLLEPESWA